MKDRDHVVDLCQLSFENKSKFIIVTICQRAPAHICYPSSATICSFSCPLVHAHQGDCLMFVRWRTHMDPEMCFSVVSAFGFRLKHRETAFLFFFFHTYWALKRDVSSAGMQIMKSWHTSWFAWGHRSSFYKTKQGEMAIYCTPKRVHMMKPEKPTQSPSNTTVVLEKLLQ